MKILKTILLVTNSMITFVMTAFLVLAGSYSLYALWDNSQVYAAADNVQAELLKMKPEEKADNGASFEELRKINPDVCGWITLDHTNIDLSVLQGKDNLTYINTDVYGEFAMAGSIFLDSGCDRSFRQKYSLLYGHHMENHQMFGDLDLYKKENFFNKNRTGTLYLPEEQIHLEVLACLSVSSSEENIFTPEKWKTETKGLLKFASDHAVLVHQDLLKELMESGDSPRILAMSTCSSEFTDARTVLLAEMKEEET